MPSSAFEREVFANLGADEIAAFPINDDDSDPNTNEVFIFDVWGIQSARQKIYKKLPDECLEFRTKTKNDTDRKAFFALSDLCIFPPYDIDIWFDMTPGQKAGIAHFAKEADFFCNLVHEHGPLSRKNIQKIIDVCGCIDVYNVGLTKSIYGGRTKRVLVEDEHVLIGDPKHFKVLEQFHLLSADKGEE